jgi:hypothetical protein
MIPVYVASSERFAVVEWMTAGSIVMNTKSPVDIRVLRPQQIGMQETGCTGFTNMRYAVPELLRRDGYECGIYLDVDMLVLGDIKDLFDYRLNGWAALADGSNEVAVIHCSVDLPEIDKLHLYNKHELKALVHSQNIIPTWWNSEDRVCHNCKILHFTNLDTQPWFHDHPDAEAVRVYGEYRQRCAERWH